MNPDIPVLGVSQVNQYIKGLMDRDQLLSGLYVRGEISNYKCYPSGHHYFTLKDGESALRCAMFRREAATGLRFRPENGMQVIALGNIDVYPREGQYRLYCRRLTPEGVGDLQVAFEQLKEKLRREGLFDPGRKRPLPAYPDRIALVTSPAGAAVRDMIRILGARWPMSQVLVLPVRVQGEEAPEEIAAAIAYADREKLADLIITGRGGGSMEDLWAFNDERVARAIFTCETPVISAVGHEPDVTIADFAADVRAATPSNAAELAVPDQNEVYALLSQLKHRMDKAMGRRLDTARSAWTRCRTSRALTRPEELFQNRRMALDAQGLRLAHALQRKTGEERERFGRMAAKLDALSPFKVLGRGYAIPQDERGRVLSSAGAVAPGDRLNLTMADGEIGCVVEESRCR